MIVLIATAWGSEAGGINAFNIGLARALAAAAPGRIACAVVSRRPDDAAGYRDGVLLIPVSPGDPRDRPARDCGAEIVHALRAVMGEGGVTHWVGHDLVTGEAAIAAAGRHGGRAVVIHHMSYLRYQNLGGGRGDETAANHERQIGLLQKADLVFGVGEWLTENARSFGARRAVTLVPGFPGVPVPRARNERELSIVMAGRFDDGSEPVKHLHAAVNGLGMAMKTAGDHLDALEAPTVTILGAGGAGRQAALEAMAKAAAGRPVNLVPASFNPDPSIVARHLAASNLVIMPSLHEGFGLIGWEAIGTGTPLILGSNTGLAHQMAHTLDIEVDGLAHIVGLDGSERDVALIAKAIEQVARDIPRALRKADRLREMLVAQCGCRWEDTARDFLAAFADAPVVIADRSARKPRTGSFAGVVKNHFPDCAELAVSAAQGATPSSMEILAELRFGVTELDIDGVEARIALKRARLRVSPRGGRIEGVRLGDPSRPAEGIEARAGGIWQLGAPADRRLPNRAMGDEALCRIEAGEGAGERASADIELTAAKHDLDCDIRTPRRRNETTKRKVMGVFLKNALFKDDSGHVLLSSARLEEPGDAN